MVNSNSGKKFELQAQVELENQGYMVLKMNPTVGFGVADMLVMTNTGVPLCFIELKDYRTGFNIEKYLKHEKYEKQVKFLQKCAVSYLVAKDPKSRACDIYHLGLDNSYYKDTAKSLVEALDIILAASARASLYEMVKEGNKHEGIEKEVILGEEKENSYN